MTAELEQNPRVNVTDVFRAWTQHQRKKVGPVSTDGEVMRSYAVPILVRAGDGRAILLERRKGAYTTTTAQHLSGLHELVRPYRHELEVVEGNMEQLRRAAMGGDDLEAVIIELVDIPAGPIRNPPKANDYAKMIDALIAWEKQESYDRKLLQPLFHRIPGANNINADRRFWLGELLGELHQMIRNEAGRLQDADIDALLERIDYLGSEAPLGRQQWSKPDARSEALRKRWASEAQAAAISGVGQPRAPHQIIRDRARMKSSFRRSVPVHDRDDLEENPPWVTKMIATALPSIEEQIPAKWMPKLEHVRHVRGNKLSADLAEYGCGAYGCVMPTLDPAVVLKLTSDPSEAKFATDLADKLPTPIVTYFHTAMKLVGQKRKGRDVFLLWREAANQVGKIDKVVGMKAEKAIGKQHDVAKAAYMAADHGNIDEYLVLVDQWRHECDEMAKIPELKFVAEGMKRAFDEAGIFISDVHGGNLGLVTRNGRSTWVITDPGNVIISSSPAEDRSRDLRERAKADRKRNPPRPKCPVDHNELKRDPQKWQQLEYVGRQVSWDDDDNEYFLELRNCGSCGSTLAIPEGGGPVKNPIAPRRGAMRFFEEHAGYGYTPGQETRRAGRIRSARELALAEYVLEQEHPDAEVFWEIDVDPGADDEEFDEAFVAVLKEDGEVLASLGAIFDPDRDYRRVIEAEIAYEAWPDRVRELAAQLQERRGVPLRLNPAGDSEDIRPEYAARVMRAMVVLGGRFHGTAVPQSTADISAQILGTLEGRGLRPPAEFMRISTKRYMEYFVRVGLVDRVARHPDEMWVLSQKALAYPESPERPRWAQWPEYRTIRGGAEGDTRTLFTDLMSSSVLADYIKSFQLHPDAWSVTWEFPGQMEIRTDASPWTIVVGFEVQRDTAWPSISIEIADLAHGVTVPDEGVHARSFPRSPQEFMAIVQPFIDRYHP